MKILLAMLMLIIPSNAHGLTVVSKDARIRLDTQKVAYVMGDIDPSSAKAFETQMLDTLGLPGDRLIVIDSSGGLAEDGQTIISLLEAEQSRGVRTVCFVRHRAYSMAFSILSRCNVRLAAPKATLLFHALAKGDDISASTGPRLTPKELRRLADQLEEDDKIYRDADMAALHMTREDFDIYAEHDHMWKPLPLVKRGYLQGTGRISK